MTRNFDRILTATFRELAPIDPRKDGWEGNPERWKWFYAVSHPSLDVNDEKQCPHIAEARKHFASLPAERRAELERTWK